MKLLRKILCGILSATMLITSAAIPAMADEDIKVTLDGKALSFDVPPQIINDRTMVPLRAIFEALGASVDWNQETKTVTSTKGDTTIKLTIDSNTMYVNNNTVTLDTPACVINDRTLVPVRAISEAYDTVVNWYGDTKTVVITSSVCYDAMKIVKDKVMKDGEYDSKTGEYSIFSYDRNNASIEKSRFVGVTVSYKPEEDCITIHYNADIEYKKADKEDEKNHIILHIYPSYATVFYNDDIEKKQYGGYIDKKTQEILHTDGIINAADAITADLDIEFALIGLDSHINRFMDLGVSLADLGILEANENSVDEFITNSSIAKSSYEKLKDKIISSGIKDKTRLGEDTYRLNIDTSYLETNLELDSYLAYFPERGEITIGLSTLDDNPSYSIVDTLYITISETEEPTLKFTSSYNNSKTLSIFRIEGYYSKDTHKFIQTEARSGKGEDTLTETEEKHFMSNLKVLVNFYDLVDTDVTLKDLGIEIDK